MLAFIAGSIFLFIFINWSFRWVVIHGKNASGLAENILTNISATTPEDLYDHTIYRAEDCVLFASHDDPEKVMVYCPKALPKDTSKIGGNLSHVFGNWYCVDMQ